MLSADVGFQQRYRDKFARYYSIVIGRAKRAPHWGVQSRFRVIYVQGSSQSVKGGCKNPFLWQILFDVV